MDVDYGIICSHYKQLGLEDLAPMATLVDNGFRTYAVTRGDTLLPCDYAARPRLVKSDLARDLGRKFVAKYQLDSKAPVEIDDLLELHDVVPFIHFELEHSFYLRSDKHFAIMLSGHSWETDRWVVTMGLAHHLLKHMDTYGMDTLRQPRLTDVQRHILQAEAEVLAMEILMPQRIAADYMTRDINTFAAVFGVTKYVGQRKQSQLHLQGGVRN